MFTSEKLLRELDRIREMMLLVPITGDVHATHFAVNIAVSAIWNLREHLRYLIGLRSEMQNAWKARVEARPEPAAKAEAVSNRHPRARKHGGMA